MLQCSSVSAADVQNISVYDMFYKKWEVDMLATTDYTQPHKQ